MKTFFKVILLAALLIVAIKLSPLIFLAAFIGLVAAAALGAVGLSLLGVLLAVLVALVTVLAPIWIPVLVVLGLISLFKKNDSQPKPPVLAA